MEVGVIYLVILVTYVYSIYNMEVGVIYLVISDMYTPFTTWR